MNLMNEKKMFLNRLDNPTKEEVDRMSCQFAIFCANFKKFQPHIKNTDYLQYYKDLLYHKWLSGKEQYDMEYLQNCKIENNTIYDLNNPDIKKPLIFATFHLGSYRLFNSFLFEQGFKIVLIIDESVFISQQNELLNVVVPMLNAKPNSDFVVLNVKDRTSIFKLKNYIMEGYVMSVYLDGNTGLNDDKDDFTKSYIPINFFNNEVYVKNGISKLAVLVSANIIPVIAHRDDNGNNTIKFYNEMCIENYTSKTDFLTQSIQDIYKLFENKLSKYQSQWESWLYIHKWFKRDYIQNFKQVKKFSNKFNDERYMFFKINKINYLFDLYNYKSYEINNDLFKTLTGKNFEEITNDLKNELILKNVII